VATPTIKDRIDVRMTPPWARGPVPPVAQRGPGGQDRRSRVLASRVLPIILRWSSTS